MTGKIPSFSNVKSNHPETDRAHEYLAMWCTEPDTLLPSTLCVISLGQLRMHSWPDGCTGHTGILINWKGKRNQVPCLDCNKKVSSLWMHVKHYLLRYHYLNDSLIHNRLFSWVPTRYYKTFLGSAVNGKEGGFDDSQTQVQIPALQASSWASYPSPSAREWMQRAPCAVVRIKWAVLNVKPHLERV